MNKLILLLSTFLLAATAHAMSDGNYMGQATWRDNSGNTGTYEKVMIIRGGSIEQTYNYGSQSQTTKFQADLDDNGFFSLVTDGYTWGQGYCMDVQCHYSSQHDGFSLEETFTFVQGQLYILGSKKMGDKVITWQESLSLYE